MSQAEEVISISNSNTVSAANSNTKKISVRKPWNKKKEKDAPTSVVGASDSQYDVLHMVEQLA